MNQVALSLSFLMSEMQLEQPPCGVKDRRALRKPRGAAQMSGITLSDWDFIPDSWAPEMSQNILSRLKNGSGSLWPRLNGHPLSVHMVLFPCIQPANLDLDLHLSS